MTKYTVLPIHLEADPDLKMELLGSDYMDLSSFPSVELRYEDVNHFSEAYYVYVNPSLVCVQKESIVVLGLRVGDKDSESYFNYLSTLPLVSENLYVYAHNPDIFETPIINEKSSNGKKVVFYEGCFDYFLKYLMSTVNPSYLKHPESVYPEPQYLTLESLVRPDPRVDLEFRLDEFSGEEWFSDVVSYLKERAKDKTISFYGRSDFGMKVLDLLDGKLDKLSLKFDIKPFEILQTECSLGLATRLVGHRKAMGMRTDSEFYNKGKDFEKPSMNQPLGFISKYSAYELCETLTEASQSKTPFRAPRISEVLTLLYGTRARIQHTLDTYSDGVMSYRRFDHPIYSHTEKVKYAKMLRADKNDLSVVYGRVSPDLLYGFFDLFPEWIHEARNHERMSKEDKRWAVYPEKDSSGNLKETNLHELVRFAALISVFEVHKRIFHTADRFTKRKQLSKLKYRENLFFGGGNSLHATLNPSAGLIFGNGLGWFPHENEISSTHVSKVYKLIFGGTFNFGWGNVFSIPTSSRKAGNIRFTRDV
jgi:hypothetical protein